MQPNQAPDPNNQFGFIMDPKQKSKLPGLMPRTTTTAGRAMLAGGLFVVVLIVVIVFSSLIKNAGKPDIAGLGAVSGSQDELIRIAGMTQNTAQTFAARNLSATITNIMLSDKQSLDSLYKALGYKEPAKVAVSQKNPVSDKTLDIAKKNNKFDEEFKLLVTSELKKYQAKLQVQFPKAKSQKEKDALGQAYKNVSLILASPISK
jgi:hypothetical protein